MKKSTKILLAVGAMVSVLVITVVSCFSLRTSYNNGQILDLSVQQGAKFNVDSQAPIDVTAVSEGYFQLISGNTTITGQHQAGKYFLGKDHLQAGRWLVQGGDITVHLVSTDNQPISTNYTPTFSSIAGLIIFMVLASLFILMLIPLFTE